MFFSLVTIRKAVTKSCDRRLGIMTTEMTCGRELAESAEVPELIGALMNHVASNLVAHATWVGDATPEGAAERAALLCTAEHYRAIGNAALSAATFMRSLGDLAAAPHDPSRFDRAGFADWMRAKIELQRELARCLCTHAATSAKELGRIEGDSQGER